MFTKLMTAAQIMVATGAADGRPEALKAAEQVTASPMSGYLQIAPTEPPPITEGDVAKALGQILELVHVSTDSHFETAVYRSPADELENQAKAIREQDEKILKAREVLWKYRREMRSK